MKVGLDVMGGDYAPGVTIDGALMAAAETGNNDRIVLVGDRSIIEELLHKRDADKTQFEIVHAPDVIRMGEHPIKAVTKKPQSSISTAARLLKSGEIDAFTGAGNSGAMLVSAMYSVSTVHGVIRPCTATFIPKENGGQSVLLDIGTVPDAKPDVMYQFAILGSLFARHILNIHDPKIGLLNIGEEEEKGNILCQSTYHLMKDSTDFNFYGNVEGRDLFNEKADVIVADGFTGNVVLKQIEAMYDILAKRNLLDDYTRRFNYENYGGSPILGINSTVVIGHGISTAQAIKNMILLAVEMYNSHLSDKIRDAFLKYSQNQ